MKHNDTMIKHIFYILTGVILFFHAPFSAHAQQCEPVGESIMNFEVPHIGSYNLWDATYGGLGHQEEYVSGFLTAEGGAVVAGHRFGRTKNDMTLVLMELDRRGRDDWEVTHKFEGVDRVYKILPAEDGFWAIGRQQVSDKRGRKRYRAWIGMFDSQGALLKETQIEEKNADIVPTDIIRTHDGKGYLLSVTLKIRGGDIARGSRVYFLNEKGFVQDKKSFLFGAENRIQRIVAVSGYKYAIVGRVRDTHRRWAGWVMLLSEDGGMEWQREYSRGSAATLDVVEGHKNGQIIVAGIARPAIKNGDRAGWVMAVDQAGGDVVWQRYYIGQSNYVAKKMITHPDGLISVLLAVSEQREGGKAVPPEQMEQTEYAHARLLTLSPRGQIFSDNTYFNGVSAEPADMFMGKNKERLIIGRSKVAYTIGGSDEEDGMPPIVEYSQDFWAVAGVSTDPYKDPCEKFISFLP